MTQTQWLDFVKSLGDFCYNLYPVAGIAWYVDDANEVVTEDKAITVDTGIDQVDDEYINLTTDIININVLVRGSYTESGKNSKIILNEIVGKIRENLASHRFDIKEYSDAQAVIGGCTIETIQGTKLGEIEGYRQYNFKLRYNTTFIT